VKSFTDECLLLGCGYLSSSILLSCSNLLSRSFFIRNLFGSDSLFSCDLFNLGSFLRLMLLLLSENLGFFGSDGTTDLFSFSLSCFFNFLRLGFSLLGNFLSCFLSMLQLSLECLLSATFLSMTDLFSNLLLDFGLLLHHLSFRFLGFLDFTLQGFFHFSSLSLCLLLGTFDLSRATAAVFAATFLTVSHTSVETLESSEVSSGSALFVKFLGLLLNLSCLLLLFA
jgi:hypothetical protein